MWDISEHTCRIGKRISETVSFRANDLERVIVVGALKLLKVLEFDSVDVATRRMRTPFDGGVARHELLNRLELSASQEIAQQLSNLR